MKFLKNILFILLFSNTLIYACPTCSIKSTTVHIEVNIEPKKDHSIFTIQWKFPQKFLLALMKHDKNSNDILDEKEQKEIQDDLDKTWKEHDFYTFVKLLKKDENLKANKGDKLTPLRSEIKIQEDSLLYTTKLKSDMVLEKNHYIYLRHFDKKMHYSFRLSNVVIEKYHSEINIKKKKYIAYIEFF